MSTVYTLNGKVLKNSATDKWLTKKDQVLFVMDASNARYTKYAYADFYIASWEAPTFPNHYNGDGKQYILVNNNATGSGPLCYAPTFRDAGPEAITWQDMSKLGTSTGVLLGNSGPDPYAGAYRYLNLTLDSSTTLSAAQAYIANISITIVNP